MPDTILTRILSPNLKARGLGEQFRRCLESDFAEGFLHILLNLMSAVFLLSSDFRRNIKDFSGRYVFKSRDNSIQTSVVFDAGQMSVKGYIIDNPNVTVVFRNSGALMNLLLSPKPDILGSVLRQDVVIDGNFNYLYKFAHMATRLRLMATGGA